MASDDSKPRWFQADLRSLLIAMTLVAIGLSLLLATIGNLFALNAETPEGLITWIGLIFASGAMIGAGVLFPIKRPTLGLIFGFLMIYPVLFLLGRLFDVGF